mmetsp:Transcript_76850/g.205339  ORF Transcript_76850/g.205339 Transcript_76850/m.205339 type:complete len:270 (-) Transcript_76850:74-883(-)
MTRRFRCCRDCLIYPSNTVPGPKISPAAAAIRYSPFSATRARIRPGTISGTTPPLASRASRRSAVVRPQPAGPVIRKHCLGGGAAWTSGPVSSGFGGSAEEALARVAHRSRDQAVASSGAGSGSSGGPSWCRPCWSWLISSVENPCGNRRDVDMRSSVGASPDGPAVVWEGIAESFRSPWDMRTELRRVRLTTGQYSEVRPMSTVRTSRFAPVNGSSINPHFLSTSRVYCLAAACISGWLRNRWQYTPGYSSVHASTSKSSPCRRTRRW